MSDTAPRATRSAALTGLFVGARVVSGLVAIGVMVATVGAAALLPLPTIGGDVRSDLIEPAPVAETRVCAGPLLRLGADDGSNATRANAIGSVDLRYASTSGTPRESRLDSTDSLGGHPPYRIDLEPAADDPALLAASQSQSLGSGAVSGLTGFAAAECPKPSSDSWLVAGSTTTGRTTLLTLANPSTVESTVTIDLYTENGPVTTTGLDGIVVPVGGQRILSIAGWAPDADSIVVRVRSAGGAVVANLQHTITRVLTPGGSDVVGAGANPSTSAIIPGFVVDAHATIEAIGLGGDNYDLASHVRLLAPDADATVTMTVRPTPGTAQPVIEDGEELVPQTLVVPLELDAGEVTDIPFDHLLDGSYTITIDSTVPIVASARSSVVGEPDNPNGDGIGAVDFAWFSTVAPLTRTALVAVAPGPGAVMHLVNPTPNPVSAAIAARTGADTVADVPAGQAIAVPLTAGGNYTITGFDTLYVTISYTGDGALAGFGITGPQPLAAAVIVYH